MSKQNPGIDQDLIRQLAALLKETELSEIEIEQNDVRIKVARQISVTAAVAPAVASAPVAAPQPAAKASGADKPAAGAVASPMVGTAYLAPEPGAAPFVEIGSTVRQGQTVLIVEAMKTMNPIVAPHAGKVTEIHVDDGQPVEYGETLLVIA